jgi:hypothetical protein
MNTRYVRRNPEKKHLLTKTEDRSRIRSGHTPQVMADLHNLVLTLIHRTGTPYIAATRRAFALYLQQTFDLLLQSQTSQQ